jgi:hypothetical protein
MNEANPRVYGQAKSKRDLKYVGKMAANLKYKA